MAFKDAPSGSGETYEWAEPVFEDQANTELGEAPVDANSDSGTSLEGSVLEVEGADFDEPPLDGDRDRAVDQTTAPSVFEPDDSQYESPFDAPKAPLEISERLPEPASEKIASELPAFDLGIDKHQVSARERSNA